MNQSVSPQMRAWAEVDLGSVERNAARILALNPGSSLIGVIKADAYGHGAVPIARTLERLGAVMVGVGDSREAIQLIHGGIKMPILILGAIVDGEMDTVIAHDIRSTIHSKDRMLALAAEAKRQGRVHHVHLKVDSGMARLGMLPERAVEVAEAIHQSDDLVLEGLCTHFSNPHLDYVGDTNNQLRVFRAVHQEVVARCGPIPLVHTKNTAASWNPDVHDDCGTAIRPGAALYGIPGPTEKPYPFEHAMTLKTQVIFLKDVPAGTAVGYSGHFTTKRPSRLATIPLGYNDGLPLGAHQGGYTIIDGKVAPICGEVSMDYTTLDVTDIPGCQVGAIATVFGRGEEGELTLVELAKLSGTSNYAITCGIGKRVHRVYVTSTLSRHDGSMISSAAAET